MGLVYLFDMDNIPCHAHPFDINAFDVEWTNVFTSTLPPKESTVSRRNCLSGYDVWYFDTASDSIFHVLLLEGCN